MARAPLKRLRSVRDRFWFPEAASGGDQWQRVVLNRAVDAHLRALDPPTKTAVEISGDAQARLPWRPFTASTGRSSTSARRSRAGGPTTS